MVELWLAIKAFGQISNYTCIYGCCKTELGIYLFQLAMDLESMDLISKKFAEGVKYLDWRLDKEEFWSMYRI